MIPVSFRIYTVPRWAANEIHPAADAAKSREIPEAELSQADQLGLVAHGLDEARGGGGGHAPVIASREDPPRAFLVPRDAAGLSATPEENVGTDAGPRWSSPSTATRGC